VAIGSLGVVADTKAALTRACYTPSEGHGWDPSEVLTWWPEGVKVDGHPKCKECRKIWRSFLQGRGLVESQIKAVFRQLGAKWDWGKRSESKATGLDAVLAAGGSYLDYRRAKDAKEAGKVHGKGRGIGDHIVWIDEELWTPEHEAHNEQEQRKWEEAVRERIAVRRAGGDPLSVALPERTVYRVREKV